MKKLILFLTSCLFLGCSHDFGEFNQEGYNKQVAKENAEKILGFKIDPGQTWCTTKSGVISVVPLPGTKTVQILVYSQDNEESNSLKVLNSCSGDSKVTLNFDTPEDYIDLYAACISGDSKITLKKFDISDNTVDFTIPASRAITRSAIDFSYTLPQVELKLTGPTDSYGKQRGWNNVTLYSPENEVSLIMEVPDFDPSFSEEMKLIIFSYLKNGKAYDNISLIKSTGLYNENAYPITTGEEDPILVCPIYRNDGTSNEIINSELYYYYFKAGTEPDLPNLKVYKAITMRNSIKSNDVLCRHHAYALIYWDEDGNGSFQFPAGYKIGFMLRSNLSAYNGQKQGELWGDGRLNTQINKYGHFKNAGMDETDPRMTWLTVNGKNLLLCESGVDLDINDCCYEILGSLEAIDIPPYIEKNSYTFFFEDTYQGDYDLQDCVIKGVREDEMHVRWTLMACGANDELYLHGISGKTINQDTEIHAIFDQPGRNFINTEVKNIPYVSEVVTVPKNFSFLSESYQPYLENRTKGYNIKVSRSGEAPYSIMIPSDLGWSKERVCITKSYPEFGNWGKGMIESTDWYLKPNEDLIIGQ